LILPVSALSERSSNINWTWRHDNYQEVEPISPRRYSQTRSRGASQDGG
jgi:hypothetical protein